MAVTEVRPVAGPLFVAVSRHADLRRRPVQRKMLALIAAYADAGEQSPTIRQLAAPLGIAWPPNVDRTLRRLERNGYLEIVWTTNRNAGERNHYTVRLPT